MKTYPRMCRVCGEVQELLSYPQATRCIPCAGRGSSNVWQSRVDEVAVQRLLSGSSVRSTRAERQLAVAALTRKRLAAAAIAERLHVTKRTVERLRARIKQVA